jgi:hypothetical protein
LIDEASDRRRGVAVCRCSRIRWAMTALVVEPKAESKARMMDAVERGDGRNWWRGHIVAGAGVEWTAKPSALDCKFRWSVWLRVGSWLGSLCDSVPTQLDSNRKIDGPREKFTVHSAPARQPAKSLKNGYHARASPSENPQNSFSAPQNYIHRASALKFNRGRHSAFTRGQPLQ